MILDISNYNIPNIKKYIFNNKHDKLIKILESISNKKISISTIQIAGELHKLSSEFQFDLIKYIYREQENNSNELMRINDKKV